jgi:TolB-like protein
MSSPSCSTERGFANRERLAALALAAALAACGHARAPPAWRTGMGARPIVAVFPMQNLSGGRAPVKAIDASLRASIEASGLAVVDREWVDAVLASRRIRYTGGLDREGATALRDELGVDAVLVSSLDLYAAGSPPAIGLSSRLVSTGDPPRILWMDRVSISGNDEPGLFGAGIVSTLPPLEGAALARLMASLRGEASGACGRERRFAPSRKYRSPILDAPDRRTIAVLPFVSSSGRRDAGELAALELVRQLVATGAFEVVEPGQVRRELLAYRVVMDGGASLDDAMVVVEQIGVDLVLAGSVLQYAEAVSRAGGPQVELAVHVLDGRTHRVVWSSTSLARGDDGVVLFGIGRVNTAGALSCRMAREVVERIAGARPRIKGNWQSQFSPSQFSPLLWISPLSTRQRGEGGWGVRPARAAANGR